MPETLKAASVNAAEKLMDTKAPMKADMAVLLLVVVVARVFFRPTLREIKLLEGSESPFSIF